MRFFYVIVSFLLCSASMFSQINLSSSEISFPQTTVGNMSSHVITITNNSTKTKIFSLKLKKSTVFTVSDSVLVLEAATPFPVTVTYKPFQNVNDFDVFVFLSADSVEAFALNMSGSGKYGNLFDAITFNLYDSGLKQALTTYVSNHTSLGYNTARDKMFMEIDNKRVNGGGATQNTLECVYTGRQVVGYTSRTDAQTSGDFNTEHTWPQSTFSEAEPMKSDLYHLFPTDVTSNSIRSNYIFSIVTSAMNWSVGGSKRGLNWNNNTVFEPRDVHKGDVARGMLYFQLRYPQNYGSFLDTSQENIFRVWNKLDTANQVERRRNTAIAQLQGKRNPLIDHPEFVDRIFSFRTNTNRVRSAQFDLYPLKGFIDSTFVGDTASFVLTIINKGDADLTINSIASNNSKFVINNTVNSLLPFSGKTVKVLFVPDSAINYNTTITVQTSVGNYNFQITGFGKLKPLSVNDDNGKGLYLNDFSLEQNYPNPFNPSTIISWQSPVGSLPDGKAFWQTLKIYDVLGNEVVTLVDEFRPAGRNEVEFLAKGLSSGIYFYRMVIYSDRVVGGSYTDTKKMILLR